MNGRCNQVVNERKLYSLIMQHDTPTTPITDQVTGLQLLTLLMHGVSGCNRRVVVVMTVAASLHASADLYTEAKGKALKPAAAADR